jgi:Fe-Mn family superoxide dismutase
MFEFLSESKTKKLVTSELLYSYTDLQPVISKSSLEYHYNTLAKNYAKKYNNKEGDREFNYAGYFLHEIYFSQFRTPQESGTPNGPLLNLIKRKYGWWRDFKEQFKDQALQIQGSGWIYLSFNGEIKTIVNHEVRDDILLLVDWWEHAFQFDYGSDKKSYLENTWKIINWSHINTRWGRSL